MARKPTTAQSLQNAGPRSSIGTTGLEAYSGYIQEEFQRELIGETGRKKYREMAENDPTISAFLFVIELLLRAAEWTVEPAEDAAWTGENMAIAAEDEAEFARSVFFDDMSHTFDDMVADALSMLVYGWSYHELIFKIRRGPEEQDPQFKSRFTDGRLGIRKIEIRGQNSLSRWGMQPDGGLLGMYQSSPQTPAEVFIPISKAVLFRARTFKGNPEGKSLLRGAYKPYYFQTRLQDVEAIGIERELTGLPVIKIPSTLLNSTAAEDMAIVSKYYQIAKDLRFNTQGGLLVPSDMYEGQTGPSSAPKVDIQLITSGGNRAIDVGAVIARYQTSIARSVMAEFLMLGSDGRGSYALSSDKTDLFVRAVETIGNAIESPLNRYVMPKLWRLNGLDYTLMPALKMGRIGPPDLDGIGKYLTSLANAGAPLFPDIDLEQALRRLAKLPEKSPEVIAEQEENAEAMAEQLAGGGGNQPGSEDGPGNNENDKNSDPAKKVEPRSLYVRRDVVNSDEISNWFKRQGVETIVDDLHVTITFSKKPVDWFAMGEPWGSKMEISEGGPRAMDMLGLDLDVLVLRFASSELEWRNEAMRDRGCSWDWSSYAPHITISYKMPGADLEKIEPYQGKIVLGPEIFEPINEDWRANVSES